VRAFKALWVRESAGSFQDCAGVARRRRVARAVPKTVGEKCSPPARRWERLVTAETELKELQRRAANGVLPTVDAVLETYRSMLLQISDAVDEDVERARVALAHVLGTVTVRNTDEGL